MKQTIFQTDVRQGLHADKGKKFWIKQQYIYAMFIVLNGLSPNFIAPKRLYAEE